MTDVSPPKSKFAKQKIIPEVVRHKDVHVFMIKDVIGRCCMLWYKVLANT